MRTSDITIAACMELMHQAFVNFRLLARVESTGPEELWLKAKHRLHKQAGEYRTVMRCLLDDVGDEKTKEIIANIKSLASMYEKEFYKHKVSARKLVTDDIKTKLFYFIDQELRFVENYGQSKEKKDPGRLYGQMGHVHNAPHAIYEERYGLLEYEGIRI